MKKAHLAPHFLDRRDFLRSTACASLGMTSMLGAIASLRPLNQAWAQGAPAGDYKALVCVYLGGGNDGANLVIPMGDEYADYANYRGTAAALPEEDLHALPAIADGRTFGLHPTFGSDDPDETTFHSLYNDAKLALVGNIGPLVVPTTKQQYMERSVPLPPQLYSHRDQTLHWQSSVTDRPFASGWGGRVADMMAPLNGEADLSISISLAGVNGFQVSTQVDTQPYRMSTSGTIVLSGFNGALDADGNYANNDYGKKQRMLDEILGTSQTNLHSESYRKLFQGARELNSLVGDTINNLELPPDYPTFGTDSLSKQMAIVAKVIAAREQLGMRRQIFFVNLGGFDTHSNHLATHNTILTRVRDGMTSLYKATVALGVENDVTSFTSSEFGRTYTPNGEGTTKGVDHAWGSNALVLGGAVNGGMIYGTMPIQIPGGPDDTNDNPNSRGYWVPTTSVDEFAATMAKWYGLDAQQLALAFPNLHRFPNPDLGFMAGA